MVNRSFGVRAGRGQGLVGALAAALLIGVACGGSSSSNGNGVPAGSALCGVNGTNQCRTGQTCSVTLGCVDCTASSMCPATAPKCVAATGACAECLSDSDCPAATPACWPGDHTCHVACAANADCHGNTPICDTTNQKGSCVGCKASTDCTAPIQMGMLGPICDPTTLQCVECETSADCPAGHPRCLVGRGQCVNCLSNADCGTAQPICDPHDFTCRAGCTSSSQCAAAAPLCQTATSTCVQCLSNTDCASHTGKLCAPDGTCAVCLANTDCPTATPMCHADQCVQCVHDKDCAAGQTCTNGACH